MENATGISSCYKSEISLYPLLRTPNYVILGGDSDEHQRPRYLVILSAGARAGRVAAADNDVVDLTMSS